MAEEYFRKWTLLLKRLGVTDHGVFRNRIRLAVLLLLVMVGPVAGWAGGAVPGLGDQAGGVPGACLPRPEAGISVAELPSTTPAVPYRVVQYYPHDPEAFTQGLLFHDGWLYESTGIGRSRSSLRRVELASGRVLAKIELAGELFGEGLTLWQDRLIQLTWRNGVARVYDRESFALLKRWHYDSEGWGLTHDGRCLIMSDGSDTLYFRDPETFALIDLVAVHDHDGPVFGLNELEYIDGQIWANVWPSDRIVRIEPTSGRVVGKLDFSGLLAGHKLAAPVDVLNGIAYDQVSGRIFITGKWWPLLFEIELTDLP